MNATQRSTLALLAGVAIGVAGIEALQAQQGKAPPDHNSMDLTSYGSVAILPDALDSARGA